MSTRVTATEYPVSNTGNAAKNHSVCVCNHEIATLAYTGCSTDY